MTEPGEQFTLNRRNTLHLLLIVQKVITAQLIFYLCNVSPKQNSLSAVGSENGTYGEEDKI